jgi:hypothetical protein
MATFSEISTTRGIMSRPKSSVIILIFLLVGFVPISSSSDLNELWLLISSYEEARLTVDELAFFLATHDYDAEPQDAYVQVNLPGEAKAYLTPIGASPGLADLWKTPPKPTGPVRTLAEDAIFKNASYNEAPGDCEVAEFTVEQLIFPVTPLGMCYDGSQKLKDIYSGYSYNVMYMYDPSEWDWQGHLWVVVETPEEPDAWLAVDSYYGIMRTDDYYSAPYSFDDMLYLDYINPKWRLI